MKNTLFVTLLCIIAMCNTVAFGQQKQQRVTLDTKLAPFYHSVASGDPLKDKVIIWTRVTPGSGITGTDTVFWRMATDTSFSSIVQSGYTFTDSTKDYTVKIDVGGLSADTWYYYDFKTQDRWSPVGRTKTAPDSNADSLRFGIVSCSNYQGGYFVAYERLVNRNDIDAIVHLGDYIYEHGAGGLGEERDHEPPHEIITLKDYRLRYSHYRLDADLQCAHQQYPWMTVWDDHESSNNSWKDGAENHDSGEGLWSDRKGYAAQAYHEWLPIRTPDSTEHLDIQRKVRYGDLVDLFMTDTRLWGRDEQAGTFGSTVTDPDRTILGHDQFDWLTSEMQDTTTQWKVIAQQVMMAPLQVFGVGFNEDQWDGYPAERQNLLDSIMLNDVENVVVLTGDIHSSWCNDLPWTSGYDPVTGDSSAAVEFVVTSVTTQGSPIPVPVSVLQLTNPWMKYVDLTHHGYMVLDINKTRAQGDYYYATDIATPVYTESFDDSWYVNAGERWLRQNGSPTIRTSASPILAPKDPRNDELIGIDQPASSLTLIGVYPNPTEDHAILQLYLHSAADIQIEVFDLQGKSQLKKNYPSGPTGLQYVDVDLSGYESGTYIIKLQAGSNSYVRRIVKL